MFARLLALPDRIAAAVDRHRTPLRAAVAIALLVVLAFTVARYVQKASRPSDLQTQTRTAFLRWQPQIQDLGRGVNIYERHNYPNPPIMALVLWPFTALPPVAGGVLWLLLKTGMTVALAVWAFRLCGPLPEPAKYLALALAIHPLLGDLNHGNVNIFITFLVLGCLELYRRRWDVPAGLTLGLAIACKVTPALFIPYFGWKAVRAFVMLREGEAPAEPPPERLGGSLALPETRWDAFWRSGGKVLFGTVLGLFLFLIAVPAAVLSARTPTADYTPANGWDDRPPPANGWAENLRLLESWFDKMVRPFLLDGKVTSIHPNQSIPGVVHRLLTHEPSAVEFDPDDGRELPTKFHNVADIGPAGARRVVQACQAAFVLLVVLLVRRSRERAGVAVAAECGLIILGMLLFSERTWKHHGTGLILPMAAILGLWTMRPSGAATKWFIVFVLYAVTGLTLIPSLLGGGQQDLALTFGTHTAAYLLLTAAVVVVLWQTRHGESPTVPAPGVSA